MKVGINFSTFDLLNAGHIKMLKEVKRQCDYLIVGLQLDPLIDRPEKNSLSQNIIDSYIHLKGSKHVDEIAPTYQTKTKKIFYVLLNWMFASLETSTSKKTIRVERIAKKRE